MRESPLIAWKTFCRPPGNFLLERFWNQVQGFWDLSNFTCQETQVWIEDFTAAIPIQSFVYFKISSPLDLRRVTAAFGKKIDISVTRLALKSVESILDFIRFTITFKVTYLKHTKEIRWKWILFRYAFLERCISRFGDVCVK